MIKKLSIALRWAELNLQNASASRISNPEKYKDAEEKYNRVKRKFDKEVIKFIDKSCKE